MQSGTRPAPNQYPGLPLAEGPDHVRLLRLHAGNDDDPIHCSLHNARLKDVSQAEALSYCWGQPPATHEIRVNDMQFLARSNLFNALQNLRQMNTDRLLWVDAICIDQTDVLERNHQVQQMAQIYGSAKGVIAWLGLETAHTRPAFELLSEAYLASPSNRKALMNDPRWRSMQELCDNEYWKRVWIVQEICLGSQVVVTAGRQRVPWQYFSELRNARKHIWPQYQSLGEREFLRSLPSKIDQQRDLRKKNSCVLWNLMESFKSSQCQEIHDKLYGFLGLSTNCGSDGITVDYTKSIDELYYDVMLFHIKTFGRERGVESHTSQLMKLSEFLQELFPKRNLKVAMDESKPSKHLTTRQRSSVKELQIPILQIHSLKSFPSKHELKHEGLDLLSSFLAGQIPYSHIGNWRTQIDPQLRIVQSYEDSTTLEITSSSKKVPLLDTVIHQHDDSSDRPCLFTAVVKHSARATENRRAVTGIAPVGCRVGDVVLTFADSKTVLFTRKSASIAATATSTSSETIRTDDGSLAFQLVGRGCLLKLDDGQEFGEQGTSSDGDSSTMTMKTLEAALETSNLQNYDLQLTINLQTLRNVTSGEMAVHASAFDRPAMSLMPDQEPKPIDAFAHRLEKTNADLDIEQMRDNPSLKQFALGPGYTTISNPASLGYMCSILQIFYMVKPFRMAVLKSQFEEKEKILNALRGIFEHLHHRYLPADPLPLTKAFGWNERQIHEVQDLFEFYWTFLGKLEQTALGPSCTNFTRGTMITTVKDPQTGETLSRAEYFYDFGCNPDRHYLSQCIRDDMRSDESHPSTLEFSGLPDVLFVKMIFYKYDFKTNKMFTWSGHFEYPSQLDLSPVSVDEVKDTKYQLHGVCVLEEVKPVPRYLLYLRPRLEDRWILFFKESVTFARHSEVFEDNFRRPGYAQSEDAPQRTPYLLLYIKTSKLDMYLG